MKISKKREIVVELRREQIVRKRAATHWMHCDGCRCESDFISLGEASYLFEVAGHILFDFIRRNKCHYKEEAEGGARVCLVSLLAFMNKLTNNQVKLIGDQS